MMEMMMDEVTVRGGRTGSKGHQYTSDIVTDHAE